MHSQIREIEEIFKSKYSQDNYIAVIREVFDGVNIQSAISFKKEYTNFSSHIEGYSHIGLYESPDSKKIAVFSVQLKTNSYVENSRSTQRSYVRKLIEAGNCDAAIVAFYAEGESRWRLSFVRLDYEMKFDNGKFKTATKLTPAKRYSFLLGKDEPCHTAIERFHKFIVDNNYHPTLDEIEEAFSVEKVTKEFFDLYCEKFYQLQEYLDSNEDFVAESQRCGFTTEQFAKKLLGQIVFLYFLQKKGWLGVNVWTRTLTEKEYNNVFYTPGAQGKIIKEHLPKIYVKQADSNFRFNSKALDDLTDDEETLIANHMPRKNTWGSGSQRFLRTIFDWSQKNGGHFFNDYLEPLFYGALNRNRHDTFDYCVALHCRVPFLSGGLFEPLDGYDWKATNFEIPDEIFSNIVDGDERKANGILDIFDRYNFTISEDEPMEREVAIDPEMLGKVFENLLEVKDRKSKGAFYTPREIVHYMCQESLINYLVRKTGLEEDGIRDFILYGDFMKDEDTTKEKRDGNGGMFISEDIFKIDSEGKVVVNRLKEIDDALATVRVADPAVGSGAFPLGMVNEIVKARQNITAYLTIGMKPVDKRYIYINERSTYILKYNAIRNSIYAVDIEPSAVDIAQLRLWLSLVIDDEINPEAQTELDGHKNPLPLPNLECNILCGNSLIDEFKGSKLVPSSDVLGTDSGEGMLSLTDYSSKAYVDKYLNAQKELFACDDPNKKHELLDTIELCKAELIRKQLEGKTSEDIQEFNKVYQQQSKPFILWQLDFARVFRENGGFDIVLGNPPYGAELSNEEKKYYKTEYSDVHMRTPDTYNYFISKSYRLLIDGGILSFIVPNTLLYQNEYEKTRKLLYKNYSLKYVINLGDNVFENAFVPTCIFISLKLNLPSYSIMYADYRNLASKSVVFGKYSEIIPSQVLDDIPSHVLGVKRAESELLKKIKAKSVLIDDVALEVAAGISTGGNSIFCVDETLISEQSLEQDIIFPMLAGKTIDSYKIFWDGKYIIYSTKNTNTPQYKNIYNYLLPFEEQLSKKRETKKGILPWWCLHWPRYPKLYEGTKILIRQTSDCIRATVDENGYYALNSLLVLKLSVDCGFDYWFVLSMLNSKLNNYIYQSLTQEKGRTFAEVKPKNVRKLYLPKMDAKEQKAYIDIAKDIMDQKVELSKGMNDIDNMIYSFYELSPEEIKQIENDN